MAIDLGNTPTGTPPSPAEKLQIRSAIGVGTTDAPTFLKTTAYDATSSASSLNGFQLSSASYAGKHGLFSRYASSNEGWALMSNGIGNIAGWTNGPGVWVNQSIGFSLGATQSTNPGTYLEVDGAAGILAQRNGSAAQSLRIYNTYTDVNNFSRLKIGYEVANYAAFVIAGEQLGSGGGRALALIGGGNVLGLGMIPNSNFNWVINAGHLLTGTDNLHDIGASGANRPRNIYAGSSLFTGSGIGVGIYHPTFGGLAFQSSGVVTIYGGSSYTTFDKFQIGGNTSAFPTLKRVGTELQVVIASTTASINVAAVDADMTFIEDRYRRKGAGSPETAVTAPIGAVYHRTDGGASTTLYVKESSPTPSTGWVAK